MSARYVEHGGLATAPGPLRCSGVTMFGFWARADRESLAALCDATFAVPSGDRVMVRPLAPWVLITFVHIERIVSEPYEHVGWLSEREVVVWVPAVAFRPPRLLPRPLRRWWLVPRHLPAATIPCMWLDNPISIASGREVYGYPKSWGCISTDPRDALGSPPRLLDRAGLGTTAPRRLSLGAFGVEGYARPGVAPPPDGEREPACRPLLELEAIDDPRAAAAAVAEPPVESLGELLRDQGRRIGAVDDPVASASRRDAIVRSRLLDALVGEIELSQLFLRQLRSASDGARAVYQEVVRAPATEIAGFGARRLPPYRLTVSHLDSHPLAERFDPARPGELRLGLEPRQRIDVGFAASFDFRVERGETLWSAR